MWYAHIQNQLTNESDAQTSHSLSKEQTNRGISILDDIINSKPNKIIISQNSTNKLSMANKTSGSHKIMK